MTLENVERALLSLRGYFGVVGCFGGNPAMHRDFIEVCNLWRKHVPADQRGIWCNNPLTPGKVDAIKQTFDPRISNCNVHLDRHAAELFWSAGWTNVVGLDRDSRHSPAGLLSMRDLSVPEEERWDLISRCDINQHWSAMICQFRGQLRAFFCEVAGAQAVWHQHDPDYPDTGLDPTRRWDFRGYDIPQARNDLVDEGEAIICCDHPHVQWWELGMSCYKYQVRQHCQDCGVPLRGYGELAQSKDQDACNQVTMTHSNLLSTVPRLKNATGIIDICTDRLQVREQQLNKVTHYLQNAGK
jgi:hypothetical protein